MQISIISLTFFCVRLRPFKMFATQGLKNTVLEGWCLQKKIVKYVKEITGTCYEVSKNKIRYRRVNSTILEEEFTVVWKLLIKRLYLTFEDSFQKS